MKPLLLTIEKFLVTNEEEFINYLRKYIESYTLPLKKSQITAWRDCFKFLKDQLENIDKEYLDLSIIFEYMLPLEKCRRPDVILLFNKKVIILEFKQKEEPTTKDIEQAIGYREDIKHFHHITERLNMNVECFIVATKSSGEDKVNRGVSILNKSNFINNVFKGNNQSLNAKLVDKWINSKYEPIPSIIDATIRLFFEGGLPYIKNIADGEIDKTVSKIKKLIDENEKNDKTKRIIFVSGVPGSGKTLVALKTLYDYNKKKYECEKISFGAVYLSGNGPLVSVLKEQLSNGKVNGQEGKAYIKGMFEYKKEFLDSNNVPENTVILFDEAQRAWNKSQMQKNYSEAEGLLKIAKKVYKNKGYVTVICFIGDGQSIYKGEEQGLELWEGALRKNNDWDIYIPSKYKQEFSFLNHNSIDDDLLLDTTIRSNFIDISKLVESVLSLDTDKCMKEIEEIQRKGFVLRVTRDFSKVIDFTNEILKKNKHNEIKNKYGLLISSKCGYKIESEVKKYTNYIFKGSSVKVKDAGKWFTQQCTNLEIAASEFLCQGLEIDYPVIIFGGDYYIKEGKWTIRPNTLKEEQYKYKDINKIMENTYRVLLSRSRKGMVIFIPKSHGFDETYEYFKNIGIEEVEQNVEKEG
ncbi:DNA/RNA helicase domain-containing protein [Clostridium baratii]|uniref:DNA/RNA helicase domain-containing protein n=1 Tax=Clostridium baratii TaxID=1561 RepID=UPI003D33D320